VTRAQLQAVLYNLRLSPGKRESLKADLTLLEAVAKGDDRTREIVRGPKTQAALDRVLAAERGAIGGPRGLA
jgi:hypothetical protein